MTVLFCDVVNSTGIGESKDPEAIRDAMSKYFSTARAVLEKHGGTLEKFIGDAVFAVFGVPSVREDDALRATRAALDIRHTLASLREGGMSFEVRIGINTGRVVAGDPASGQTLVTGDAVNLAARLQQVAEPSSIVVGEQTEELVRSQMVTRDLGRLDIKGKSEQIRAFEVVRAKSVDEQFPRRPFSRLVGRSRELDFLQDALERAISERICFACTLFGVAGMGKTTLVNSFLSGVGDGITVGRGQCPPYGETVTFLPALDVLSGITGTAGGNSDGLLDALSALLAEDPDRDILMRHLKAVVEREELVSVDETGWAIRRVIETVASAKPLIVVFDDIHWAEEPLLGMIEDLGDLTRDVPVLLLCLSRPDLLDRREGWGGGRLNAASVSLEGLAAVETEQLLLQLLDEADPPGHLKSAVLERAEGNPLYVEEMVNALIDRGALVHADDGWRFREDPGDEVVPASIEALIASRLDQLSGGQRALLQDAAVIGRIFARSALVSVSEAAEAEVADLLRGLVRKELLRPERMGSLGGGEAFGFKHALTRAIAYESTPKRRRASAHRAAAEWMKSHGDDLGEIDELIGYHLEQAFLLSRDVDPDLADPALAQEAAERLTLAGEAAFRSGNVQGTVDLLVRAKAIIGTEEPLFPRIAALLAIALSWAGDLETSREVALAGKQSAERLGDAAATARCNLGLVGAEMALRGVTQEMIEEARAIRSVLAEADDPEWLARAVKELALAIEPSSAPAEAIRLLEETQTLAGRAGDALTEGWATYAIATIVAWGEVPAAEALASCERLLEQELLASTRLKIELVVAYLRAMLAPTDELRVKVGELVGSIQQMMGEGSAVSLCYLAAGAFQFLGDLASAERVLVWACDCLERQQEVVVRPSAEAYLANILCDQGRPQEAEAHAAIAEALAVEDDLEAMVDWKLARGRIQSLGGSSESAVTTLTEALSLVEQGTDFIQRGRVRLALSEAEERAGNRERARRLLQEALELFDNKGDVMDAARARQMMDSASAP